jgi:hypothetical protein
VSQFVIEVVALLELDGLGEDARDRELELLLVLDVDALVDPGDVGRAAGVGDALDRRVAGRHAEADRLGLDAVGPGVDRGGQERRSGRGRVGELGAALLAVGQRDDDVRTALPAARQEHVAQRIVADRIEPGLTGGEQRSAIAGLQALPVALGAV